MPRTFIDDMGEIAEVFPAIGPKENEAMLRRAVIDICNENDLAFMIAEGTIDTEAAYSTGTVAVNGTAVTLTGGAWDVAWTNRKIQIQGRLEVYSVTVTGVATGTLATAWRGASASGLAYKVFRDVYAVPADCEMAKELLLWDLARQDPVDFVDYGLFRAKKRDMGVVLGDPCEVTRIALTAAGIPQFEFGPRVPSTARTYALDYYRSPVKPTALTDPYTPTWPEAFSDVRILRVLWKYADKKGHARRFEYAANYAKRVWEMTRQFDGGNEMRRRLEGTKAKVRGSAGFRVIASRGGIY